MKRPVLLTILSLIHYIIGAFLLFQTFDIIILYLLYKTIGAEIISSYLFNLPMITGDYPYLMITLLYALLSFISFYAGYGIWRGWNWIWYLEIGLNFVFILNILFMALISDNPIIGSISLLNVLIIYLFRKEEIKRYFNILEVYDSIE